MDPDSHGAWFDGSVSEREALLSTAEQIVQMGSWSWDFKTQVVSWSDGVYRILGLDPKVDHPSVEKFDASIHPGDWDELLRTREEIIRTGQGQVLEVRMVRPSGDVRDVVLTATMFSDGNGNVIRSVGTMLDVTDRKALERQLLQTQKLDVLGKLASGVAHDFNNVLTAIQNFAFVLETRLQDQGAEDLHEIAVGITSAAENGAAVTSRLLTFAHNHPLRPIACELRSLLIDTEAMLHSTAGPRIELRCELPPPSLVVIAERSQLQSAILNLTLNARDAISGQGRIEIVCESVELDESHCLALAVTCNPGQYVRLTVRDDGMGMEKEVSDHIFEPFFTTKRAGTGSGLGLASVSQVVQHIGGGVSVHSEPDCGTEVSLYIPVGHADCSFASADETQSKSSGTVLVIDDDLHVRRSLEHSLHACGFSVITAPDGTIGLDCYRKHAANLDAVIADVMMPNCSGWEVVKEIRSKDPDLPCILISGFNGESITSEQIDDQEIRFVQKPFDTKTLVAELTNEIDRHKTEKAKSN